MRDSGKLISMLILMMTLFLIFNVDQLRADMPQENVLIQGQIAAASAKSNSYAGAGAAAIAGVKEITHETTMHTEGDEVKNYVLVAPSTVAGEGQQATSAYSLFGGINLTSTEEAQRCEDNINLLVLMAANDIISDYELKELALKQYAQIEEATRPKRLLGVLWKTSGVHLINGFGLLAWDDLWIKKAD